MIKNKTRSKLVFCLIILILIFCMGCDGKTQAWEPPNTIERENAYRLGSVMDWLTPNKWIFLASSASDPFVLAYDLDSEEVEVISTPDITIFPQVALAPNGEMVAYSVHYAEPKISVRDISRNEQIILVNGQIPAFSSDSKKLSVWRDNELFVIDLETKEEEMIYQIDEGKWEEVTGWAYSTKWNPTNETIAFITREDETRGLNPKMIVVDANSGGSTILVSKTTSIFGLSWSPDGRMIAYGSGTYKRNELIILDAFNNCTIAEIQFRNTDFPYPFWSPDGAFILYDDSVDIKILDILEYFGVEYNELACEN